MLRRAVLTPVTPLRSTRARPPRPAKRPPRTAAGAPTWARPPPSSCCGTARRRSPRRSASPAAAAPTPNSPRRAGSRPAVAERCGLKVRVDEGLREADFGDWEGLTFAEVQQRWPDDLNKWLSDTEVAPTGGGESFATVAQRIAVTRDRLIARYAGRTVLLVTHVTPIKTLVRLALEAPPSALFRMELSAACVSAVAYYADGNASVRLVNDTSHLR